MIWRVYYQTLGNHVHGTIFCGKTEGSLGNCGNLVFRKEEFEELKRIKEVLQIDFRQGVFNAPLPPNS